MNESTTADDLEPSANGLPDTVHHLQLDGRDIYVVGTAHVSQQSVEDVRKTIERVEPDTICVELCEGRYQNLMDREAWQKLDIFKVLKEGKAPLLLSSLVMTSFQKRIGQRSRCHPRRRDDRGHTSRQGARARNRCWRIATFR